MQLNLDISRTRELMYNFYLLTGIKIVLFDADYNEILAYPDGHCDFCRIMHSSSKTRSKCFTSNARSFERCKKAKALTIYHCHAGLVEATAPICDEGVVLGYVMFGQITDNPNREEFLKNMARVCENYGLPPEYSDMAKSIKYHSVEQVNAAAKILEACTCYVLLNDLISIRKDQILLRINEYIDEHISEDISVDDLCKQFHISRSALYRFYSENQNIGIAAYIKSKRMEKAKQLLRETMIPIREVALKCGYSDYNYFCRSFKKYMGIPAKKFRNSFDIKD